ncbi:hypothetical protein GEMRC1_006063 [Eukaryota sp. GEM-RC1]
MHCLLPLKSLVLLRIDVITDVIDVALMSGHLVCMSCTLNLTVFDGIVTGNATLQLIDFQSIDDVYYPLSVGYDSDLILLNLDINFLDIACLFKCTIFLSGTCHFSNVFRIFSFSESATLINTNSVFFDTTEENLQLMALFINHGQLFLQSNPDQNEAPSDQSNDVSSYIDTLYNYGTFSLSGSLVSISSLFSLSSSIEHSTVTCNNSVIIISDFTADYSNIVFHRSRIVIDQLAISNSSCSLLSSELIVVSNGILNDNCLFEDGILTSQGVLKMNTSSIYLHFSTLVFEGTVIFPFYFEFQAPWGTSRVVFNSSFHIINDSHLSFFCDCSFESSVIFTNSVITFNGVVSFFDRVSVYNSTLIFNDVALFLPTSVVDGDSHSNFKPSNTLTVMGRWNFPSFEYNSSGVFHFVNSSFFTFSLIRITQGTVIVERSLDHWTISHLSVMSGTLSITNCNNITISAFSVYSGSVTFLNVNSLEVVETTLIGGYIHFINLFSPIVLRKSVLNQGSNITFDTRFPVVLQSYIEIDGSVDFHDIYYIIDQINVDVTFLGNFSCCPSSECKIALFDHHFAQSNLDFEVDATGCFLDNWNISDNSVTFSLHNNHFPELIVSLVDRRLRFLFATVSIPVCTPLIDSISSPRPLGGIVEIKGEHFGVLEFKVLVETILFQFLFLLILIHPCPLK